jgi:DNA-binding transcriptional LysR family regulator
MSTSGATQTWPQLDLREIHVFLVLADELHFGRTAGRLGITAPYVSHMIRTLEARVGGKLFERTSRRVWLTPIGERLRDNVAGPYAQLQHGLADAREAAVGVAGTLRIGIYSRLSCGPQWLQIVRTFKTRHPGCAIEIVDTKFEQNYLDVLRRGEVDMLATRLPLSDGDITVGPILSREPRVLLVAKDDPLAQRQSVLVEDFAGRAIPDAPGFPREMMESFFPRASPSGRIFPRITVRSFEEGVMLVATGQMVHPTVASFLQHYSHDAIAAVPISDLTPSETALAWAADNRSAKIAAFAQAAADTVGVA